MVKTLFYTGTRVSEFISIQVVDLRLDLEPPQVYIAIAQGGSDGYVPILPALAQELRTHLGGRKATYPFESSRRAHDHTWRKRLGGLTLLDSAESLAFARLGPTGSCATVSAADLAFTVANWALHLHNVSSFVGARAVGANSTPRSSTLRSAEH
jgi:integrase